MDDVRSFLDGAKAFFEAFAAVSWGALGLAVFFHVLKLVLRVRAWQNILHAAYPGSHAHFGGVFGAYAAGVGVNSIVPARGGDLVKVYLVHQRMPGSSYPTLGSTLIVETLFDFVVATGLLLSALALGILPGLPDLPALPAFDWSFLVEHPRIAAFLGAVLLGGAIIGAAWAARRVVAFKEKVALGFAALHDRRAFLRGVVSWQALSWVARIASVFFFLRAFHVDATVETTLAVLVVQGLSTVLPFTPGGAGTQQAVLVFALGGAAAPSLVLAFSFGMQLVTVIVNVVLGFGAIAIMLRTFRWRRHIRARRGELAEEEASNGEPADAQSRSVLPG
ncbi:MAG: lysylphosphatidylglycerol synthase transmembrane domain-containing protein [Gaiellaceae bacterium]